MRTERWDVSVEVEREPVVHWRPAFADMPAHFELEDAGEVSIPLDGELLEAMLWKANASIGSARKQLKAEFELRAELAENAVVLSLVRRPVEPAREPMRVCPSCAALVHVYVIDGKLPCPLCGYDASKQAEPTVRPVGL